MDILSLIGIIIGSIASAAIILYIGYLAVQSLAEQGLIILGLLVICAIVWGCFLYFYPDSKLAAIMTFASIGSLVLVKLTGDVEGK